jgi:hypothetical protein
MYPSVSAAPAPAAAAPSRTQQLCNQFERSHLGLFPQRDEIDELIKTDCEAALTKAGSIEDKYTKDQALRKITLQFAKNGAISRAQEVAKMISNIVIFEAALCLIANTFARSGMIRQAGEVIRTMPRQEFIDHAFKDLAAVCASMGQPDDAMDLVTYSIKSDYVKDLACRKIVDELLERKEKDIDIETIINFAESISDTSAKPGALQNISLKVAKDGNVALAEKIARSIVEPCTQKYTLELIPQLASMKI